MLAEGHDYKEILREELESRLRANPRYSLRAFARDLHVSPSRLSEIFSGKQGLSRPAATRIAKRLGYNRMESEHFCDLVESVHARSKLSREIACIRVQSRSRDSLNKTLEMDAFKAVSDWYHFAILCLIELEGFQPEPEWIAKKLRINAHQAATALERLERLNLIAKQGASYRAVQDYVSTAHDVPSEAIKRFHQAILEKASIALRTQSVEEREFSSIMLSLDSARVLEAKEKIRKFGRALVKSMDSSPKKNRLYCLSTQFFKLD